MDERLNMTLAETLDVSAVRTLHGDLTPALQAGIPVILDASNVARVDAAALQLFVALFSASVGRPMTVEWRSPSQAIAAAADLLGLGGHIGLCSEKKG